MELEIFLTHLVNSFKRFTNEDIIKPTEGVSLINSLNELESPVLSHQTESDPIINFANNKALELWETSFEEFTSTPSRLTAEKAIQNTRESFLNEVKQNGFTKGYHGIRISKRGNRFSINDAIVWNVLDEEKNIIGQAATFKNWKPLN